MISCWHPDPSERPSFSDLVTTLEQKLFNRGVSIECSYCYCRRHLLLRCLSCRFFFFLFSFDKNNIVRKMQISFNILGHLLVIFTTRLKQILKFWNWRVLILQTMCYPELKCHALRSFTFAWHMPRVIGQGCRLACFSFHNLFTSHVIKIVTEVAFFSFYVIVVFTFDTAFFEFLFSSDRIIRRKKASKLNLKEM